MLETCFCSICGEGHETELCSMLVSMKVINDTFILSKARLTLPENLSVSDRVDGSTSVIAKTTFDIGIRFGPFKAKTSGTLNPNVNFPLKLFNSVAEWDGEKIVYSDVYLETDDEENCNWMCLVSFAVVPEEQNLFCFQMSNALYFLVIKEINVGDELKVWYAPYYAKQMNSHELHTLASSTVKGQPTSPPIQSLELEASAVIIDDHPGDYITTGLDTNVACRNSSKNVEGGGKVPCKRSNGIKKRAFSKKTKPASVPRPLLPSGFPPVYYLINSLSSLVAVNIDGATSVANTAGECNSNENNSLMLTCNNFSPLLLGARQVKSEWQCNVCSHIEYNVASYAKHLMSHYKPSSSSNGGSKLGSSHVCKCKKRFMDKQALNVHLKTCPSIKATNGADVSNSITSDSVMICDKITRELSKIVYSNGNKRPAEEDLSNKVVTRIIKEPESEVRSPFKCDVGINGSRECNGESECDKSTKFICYNFNESLTEFDEHLNTGTDSFVVNTQLSNNSCKNGSMVNDPIVIGLNHQEYVRVTSNNESAYTMKLKLGHDANFSTTWKNNEQVSRSMNIVDNPMPPILDLADDIVFENHLSKSLTNLNDIIKSSDVIVTSVDKMSDVDLIPKRSISKRNCDKHLLADANNSNGVKRPSDTLIDQIDLLVMQEQERRQIKKDRVVGSDGIDKCSTTPMDVIDDDDEYRNRIVENLLSNHSGCDVSNDMIVQGVNDYGIVNESLQSTVAESISGKDQLPTVDCTKRSTAHKDKTVLKEFQCDICKKKFGSSWYLYRHLRRHTGEFMCSICMTVFARKETLMNHTCSVDQNITNIIRKNRTACCNLCGQVFARKSEFKKHCDTEHQATRSITPDVTVIPSMCINCRKVFNSVEELQVHVKDCINYPVVANGAKEENIPKWLCDKCGTTFKGKRAFTIHWMKHEQPQFPCPVCQKQFYRKDILQEHLLSHDSAFKHECRVCNKKFTRRKALETHMLLHTDRKQFECNHCNMRFYQKGNLQKHLKTHNECLQYKCNLCPKMYATEELLKAHKHRHKNRGEYACPYCNMTLKYKTTLKRHIEKLHPNEKNDKEPDAKRNQSARKNPPEEENDTIPFTDPDNVLLLNNVNSEAQLVDTVTPSIIANHNCIVNETDCPTSASPGGSLMSVDSRAIVGSADPMMALMLNHDDVIIGSTSEVAASASGAVSKELVNFDDSDCAMNTENKVATDYFYYILTPNTDL